MARQIQTLIFSKETGDWTAEKARTWCDEHDFRSDKMDETEPGFRFRQFEPSECRADSFVTLTENFPAGVSAVSCDREARDLRSLFAAIALLNGGAGGVSNLGAAQRHAAYQNLAAELRSVGFEAPALRSRWDEAYDRFEVRTVPSELRAEGDGESRTIAGRGVPYGVLSESLGFGREMIERGVFAKTLQEQREIVVLYNHSHDRPPLGSTTSGTLQLDDRADGLHFRLRPPRSAQREIEAVERRDLRHMSFGFRSIRDEWSQQEGEEPVRRVLEAELIELSLTPFPAYRQSSAALRSLERWAVEGLTPEEIGRRVKSLIRGGEGIGQRPISTPLRDDAKLRIAEAEV